MLDLLRAPIAPVTPAILSDFAGRVQGVVKARAALEAFRQRDQGHLRALEADVAKALAHAMPLAERHPQLHALMDEAGLIDL